MNHRLFTRFICLSFGIGLLALSILIIPEIANEPKPPVRIAAYLWMVPVTAFTLMLIIAGIKP
jgi:hypothetical protein